MSLHGSRTDTGPPKKETPSSRTALSSVQTNLQYRRKPDFQAVLKRREGDVVAIGELMPRVLAITLAQGVSHFGKSPDDDTNHTTQSADLDRIDNAERDDP